MGCNAHNHRAGCDCGFGGDTGAGFLSSHFWSSGDVALPQEALRQVCFNATCPLCGEQCYYYENEFGSKVWFDELGVPWTKHPCFDVQTERQLSRPKEVPEPFLSLEPSVRRLFSKPLWQKRNWYFSSVFSGERDFIFLRPGEKRTVFYPYNKDCTNAIGYFVSRKPLNEGSLNLISWADNKFFALQDNAKETLQIYPVVWRDRSRDCFPSTRIQCIAECFLEVIDNAKTISDPQDRMYLADQLYDQTDLPFDTIAFLARVPVIEVIKISNGDMNLAYVRNLGKVRSTAAAIAKQLHSA